MTLRVFANAGRLGTLAAKPQAYDCGSCRFEARLAQTQLDQTRLDQRRGAGMKRRGRHSVLVAIFAFSASLFVASFSAVPAFAAGKQTLTGEVGDAMCGKQHMEGAPAECTHTCVSHGSKYALVVGDKIYTIE